MEGRGERVREGRQRHNTGITPEAGTQRQRRQGLGQGHREGGQT